MKMNPEWWKQVEAETDSLIPEFVSKLKDKFEITPDIILRKKNPFLLRARDMTDSKLFSKMIIDAYISSSEETMFGDLLEKIVIIICKHARNGRKSSTEGLDIEYEKDDMRVLVQVKSSVNWGNSSQREMLRQRFERARRVLGQSTSIMCIEGCCYGKSCTKDMGSHIRMVGIDFWNEISGWDGTTMAVMTLLGKHAENGLSKARESSYTRMESYLLENDITKDGHVNWERLLDFILGSK